MVYRTVHPAKNPPGGRMILASAARERVALESADWISCDLPGRNAWRRRTVEDLPIKKGRIVSSTPPSIPCHQYEEHQHHHRNDQDRRHLRYWLDLDDRDRRRPPRTVHRRVRDGHIDGVRPGRHYMCGSGSARCWYFRHRIARRTYGSVPPLGVHANATSRGASPDVGVAEHTSETTPVTVISELVQVAVWDAASVTVTVATNVPPMEHVWLGFCELPARACVAEAPGVGVRRGAPARRTGECDLERRISGCRRRGARHRQRGGDDDRWTGPRSRLRQGIGDDHRRTARPRRGVRVDRILLSTDTSVSEAP